MRFQWIVAILSNLVSMGLLVIVVGQYQVFMMLNRGAEKLQKQLVALDEQYINEDLFKVTVEKLLVQGTKIVEDLEATVAKLGSEIEKKKTENDACQAEKKTITDELPSVEKEHTDTEASFKAELDAWKQEINTLQAQLTEYRPICDYVKKVPLALKLCGKKTADALKDDTAIKSQ